MMDQSGMPHFSNYWFYDEIGMFIQILQSYAVVATNKKLLPTTGA